MSENIVSGDVRMLLDGLEVDSILGLRALISLADPTQTAVPLRIAKRLLAEYDSVVAAHFGDNDESTESELDAIRREFLDGSPLVVRSPESVDQKGRRYLYEGRLRIARLRDDGLVVASCRGSGGAVYRLGFDPAKREWRCTCPVPGRVARCSHVAALRLVLGR